MVEVGRKKVHTWREYSLLLSKLKKAGFCWIDGDSLDVPYAPDEPFPLFIHLEENKKIWWDSVE